MYQRVFKGLIRIRGSSPLLLRALPTNGRSQENITHEIKIKNKKLRNPKLYIHANQIRSRTKKSENIERKERECKSNSFRDKENPKILRKGNRTQSHTYL